VTIRNDAEGLWKRQEVADRLGGRPDDGPDERTRVKGDAGVRATPTSHGTGKAARTPAVTVRRPTDRDLPAILEISNWAIRHTAANFRVEPETLDHWVNLWTETRDRYPWFVAEADGAVIGFAMATPFKGRCAYAFTAEVSVYVAPQQQGKGVGEAMYRRLMPTLKAHGFRTLVAVIAIPNPASERLHEKFGFKRVGTLERVGWKLGRWHDVTYWQCILRADDDEPIPLKAVDEVGENVTGDA